LELITFYLAQISHEHQKGSRLNITKAMLNQEQWIITISQYGTVTDSNKKSSQV